MVNDKLLLIPLKTFRLASDILLHSCHFPAVLGVFFHEGLYEMRSKNTANAAAKCHPTERRAGKHIHVSHQMRPMGRQAPPLSHNDHER